MIDNVNKLSPHERNSTIEIHRKPSDSPLGTETNTTAQASSKSEKNGWYYLHEILKGIAVFK